MIPYSPLDSINILRPQAFPVSFVKNTGDKANHPVRIKPSFGKEGGLKQIYEADMRGNLRANFDSIPGQSI